MKRVLLIITVATALGVGLATVALGDEGNNDRFVVGEQFHFTGPSSSAGTFSLAGAFSDSGSEASTFAVSPGKDDTLVVTGTDTLTGSLGTITATFKVKGFPASAKRVIAEGRAVIVSATGAYSDLVGTKLHELGVVDTITNNHTQTLDSSEGA